MAGAQCCENPPTLSSASGQGSVVESIGGLKAYTAGSSNSKAAVVLVSDVYGYEAPNLRYVAEIYVTSKLITVKEDFVTNNCFL
ncbi:hypothetical protein ZIOFF_024922 [Zingiber officinale]|uniref:Uncharacterized protein n=1 Tax=Zingiber officinale TaxID=94328 RepID=A0A8J5H313_ZINOF|nr:hypothetical protein ZIOFF_024922 [Zingiber officinale]